MGAEPDSESDRIPIKIQLDSKSDPVYAEFRLDCDRRYRDKRGMGTVHRTPVVRGKMNRRSF